MKRISIMVKAQKDYWKSVGHQMEGKLTESGIMYRAGVKKYGKEGMKKIQSAAGKGEGHEEIGKIKDKYDKSKKEGKLSEGTRTTTFGIPETDKKAVKQIIQKLKLKHGEHYDFGVGRGATFVLSVYKKYESVIVDAFKKYRVRFKEVR